MNAARIAPILGHPATAIVAAIIFAAATLALGRGALDLWDRWADDDPVKIADQALDRTFDRGAAEREIQSALAAGDADLGRSFVDLAVDRGISVDPQLVERVTQDNVEAGSVVHTAGRFVQGLWSGEPVDLASLAGTAVGDLFVFGDIRDAAREGTRYLTGRQGDPWILGLAGVGLAITAGTYASLGVGAPARIGLSVVKAARRTGRLNPVLAARVAREAVKVEEAGGLLDLVGNVGRLESKAGAQAALESLQIAEGSRDVSRLARLAAAKGGKTRAIIKLLGRSAIVLAFTVFDVATWLIWAALALLGFVSSCKATVERITLRQIERRKARTRAASLQALAMPSAA